MANLSFAFPQPLTDRYQPTAVQDFVGLEKPRKILQKFVENPFPSAWLFVGPSGTGKTSMALAISKAIAGELHHIPSQACDLAAVKRVTDTCHYYPRMMEEGKPGKFHVVLADEADQMSPASQLAFLSLLDGTATPPNTVFIFTANAVDRLQDRFLSRCRRVDFSSYGLAEGIAGLLARIWNAETDNPAERPNFARIAKESNNNVRDALMTLEVQIMGA
jgi:DNA polymerase III gamma/tau subunit